jgi:hypothetical protein
VPGCCQGLLKEELPLALDRLFFGKARIFQQAEKSFLKFIMVGTNTLFSNAL